MASLKTDLTTLTTVERSLTLAGIMALAMADNLCVNFEYDGKNRTVEVHAIGKSTKDGSIVMRGYQTDGEASRPLPQWTLFSVDKISELVIQYDESEAPRDGYRMGDKQMDPVLVEIDTSAA